MDSKSDLGDVVTGFVAQLTGRPHDELPSAEGSRDDWLAVLRQWLARHDCGLVSIANPEKFSWPGHWIGVVDHIRAEIVSRSYSSALHQLSLRVLQRRPS